LKRILPPAYLTEKQAEGVLKSAHAIQEIPMNRIVPTFFFLFCGLLAQAGGQ
jgi:hypothetical protein